MRPITSREKGSFMKTFWLILALSLTTSLAGAADAPSGPAVLDGVWKLDWDLCVLENGYYLFSLDFRALPFCPTKNDTRAARPFSDSIIIDRFRKIAAPCRRYSTSW